MAVFWERHLTIALSTIVRIFCTGLLGNPDKLARPSSSVILSLRPGDIPTLLTVFGFVPTAVLTVYLSNRKIGSSLLYKDNKNNMWWLSSIAY